MTAAACPCCGAPVRVDADDIDGGPDSALRTVQVMICQANQRLARHGFVIRAGRGNRNGYRVERLA